MKTNKLSRKANELFKSHGVDAEAEGNDYLGIIRVEGNVTAAEVILASHGFNTAIIGGKLCAQK